MNVRKMTALAVTTASFVLIVAGVPFLAAEHKPALLKCTITSSSSEWSKKAGNTLTVLVQNDLNRAITIRLLPSIHLISVPTTSGEAAHEYWAPFRLNSQSTEKWQDLKLKKGQSIKLEVPTSNLLWSNVNSSAWPADSFSELIPRGEYRGHVQFDFKAGQPTVSNNLSLSISE